MGTLMNVTNATTNQATGNLNVASFKGITVVLNVSAITAGSLTLNILGVDPVSGNTFPLLGATGSGAISAAGTTAHTIYPGLINSTTAGANSYQNGILPTLVQVTVAVTTGPATFTVGAILTT